MERGGCLPIEQIWELLAIREVYTVHIHIQFLVKSRQALHKKGRAGLMKLN